MGQRGLVAGTTPPSVPALPTGWIQRFSRRLPGLVRDIVAAVVEEIPEYRDDLTGPVAEVARTSVQAAVRRFVDDLDLAGGERRTRTVAFSVPDPELEIFTRLGRAEALSGRSHDTLQSAYRIASRTIMRQLLEWEREFPIPAARITELSSAIFAYIDALAEASARGYAEGLRAGPDLVVQRGALLGLLLRPDGAAGVAARSRAQRLGWAIPERATLVEIRGLCDDLHVLAAFAREVLGPDVLAGRALDRALAVVPSDELPADLAHRVRLADPGADVIVGLPAAVGELGRSYRWIRNAADLAPGEGDVPVATRAPVLRCADRVVDLLLGAGAGAHEALIRDSLAPLLALTPVKRVKYGRLLSAWLELGTTRADVPGVLDKHRQTLRYQVRRLEELFGDALADREQRLRIMLALRVALPRWTRAVEPAGARSGTSCTTSDS